MQWLKAFAIGESGRLLFVIILCFPKVLHPIPFLFIVSLSWVRFALIVCPWYVYSFALLRVSFSISWQLIIKHYLCFRRIHLQLSFHNHCEGLASIVVGVAQYHSVRLLYVIHESKGNRYCQSTLIPTLPHENFFNAILYNFGTALEILCRASWCISWITILSLLMWNLMVYAALHTLSLHNCWSFT